MKLEQQVTSLELSKKLKELGVKQESVFTWVMSTISGDRYKDGEYKLESFSSQFHGAVSNYYAAGRDHEKYPMFSAYTVAELISMLQSVAQNDIIVAWSDDDVANHLAKQLISHYEKSKN